MSAVDTTALDEAQEAEIDRFVSGLSEMVKHCLATRAIHDITLHFIGALNQGDSRWYEVKQLQNGFYDRCRDEEPPEIMGHLRQFARELITLQAKLIAKKIDQVVDEAAHDWLNNRYKPASAAEVRHTGKARLTKREAMDAIAAVYGPELPENHVWDFIDVREVEGLVIARINEFLALRNRTYESEMRNSSALSAD